MAWSSPQSQVRLRPTTEINDADIEPMDLSKMDDDPMSYFLTPAPLLDPYNEDAMDFDMDFDAGIEDFKHPPPIVRSVSPSSLEGLSLPPHHHRPPTPPKSPGTPDSSTDQPLTPDDHEDYMRFASLKNSRSLTFPIRLADITGKKFTSRHSGRDTGYLSPEITAIGSPVRVPSPLSGYTSSSSSTNKYGTSSSSSPRGRTRTMPPRRRSPHAWRQPSPDVWSIEEETQDAIENEIGGESERESRMITRARARAIEIPAAKPTKRVRFVLPVID
ncbi:hypothetical protein V8F20_006659 [Naviculisporaceae sp. PSN 640]